MLRQHDGDAVGRLTTMDQAAGNAADLVGVLVEDPALFAPGAKSVALELAERRARDEGAPTHKVHTVDIEVGFRVSPRSGGFARG
jgi:hypothetical protein